MWVWTLNWNEIRGDLLIGSCPMTPADVETIRTGTRASAMLSLQTDACRGHFGVDYGVLEAAGERLGLVMACAPMRDFDLPDQRRNLAPALRALHALMDAGHRVYVHCTAGLGRAPLTVVGYLTLVEGLSLDRALAEVKGRRTGASPGLEAYFGCRQDLLREHRGAIARRAHRFYEERRSTGRAGSPEGDWYRAEREVLRIELTSAIVARSSPAGTPPQE